MSYDVTVFERIREDLSWMSVVSALVRRVLTVFLTVLSVIGRLAAENARELVFFCGLSLVSVGVGLIYLPAALIVPGAILTWLAIPPAPRARKL